MKILTERRFKETIDRAISRHEKEAWLHQRIDRLMERIDKLEYELHELRCDIKGGTPVCKCDTTPESRS